MVGEGDGMTTKPKLGVLPIAKKNHQKEELYELVRFYKERFSTEADVELVMGGEALFTEADVVGMVREMEAEGVDLIVFVVGTWVFSSIVIAAAYDLHTPFILYGLSDRIANGNLGASLQIRYVLQEMGKRFPYLSGRIRNEKNIETILKRLRAAWVRNRLKNRKIATVGGKCMMMYQTQVNEYSWKSTFGVDFPQYDAVHVFTEMENVDEAEANRVAEEFLGKIDKVNWETEKGERIEKDAIVSQAKMYLAFKRLQKLYGIDVFANKCMPEMSHLRYGYGYAGCLATCMLNEDDVVTACEADVPAGLSMYILHLLTGRKVFFADIARLNKPAKRITFFNCGTAPMSMADRAQGVELWPIPGNIADEAVPDEYSVGRMKGACLHFELEHGKAVTLLRIGGNGGTLRFHVARATTGVREVEPDEVLGNRWPGFGLEFKNDLDAFLENTTGHHYSIVFGDCVGELRHLADILGIRFVYDE
jgi:L-fucose isomerase-like protein